MLSALRLFCTIDGVSPYRYQATTWWSDPDGESWEATFYWADVDGTAQVVGFDLHGFTGEWGDELEPVDEGESIPTLSASLLRQVPFGRLVDQSWRESRAFDEVLAGVTDDPVGALLSIQADLPPKGANEPQGRPTRVGLSHLGLVADIYKRARAAPAAHQGGAGGLGPQLLDGGEAGGCCSTPGPPRAHQAGLHRGHPNPE